jgi:hypothetical protein
VSEVGGARINWDKAAEIALKFSYLATKYNLPLSDLYSLMNAVEARNEDQFLTHLYWLLRAIAAAELYKEDGDVREVVDKIREELFK